MTTDVENLNVVQQHQNQQRFLNAYAELGNVTAAAAKAGVDRTTHYWWMSNDKDYPELFQEAVNTYADSLEGVLHNRIHDTTNPGSTTCLIFRLKALRPDVYRDNVRDVRVSGAVEITVSYDLGSLAIGQGDDTPALAEGPTTSSDSLPVPSTRLQLTGEHPPKPDGEV